jgi:glutaconyl-CoA/methylmalonyl-CoA decarboxylase subunit gamma
MKKLLVTVNGIKYEVDVEVLEDDEQTLSPAGFIQMPNRPSEISKSGIKTSSAFSGKRSNVPQLIDKNQKFLNSPINGIILEIPIKEGQTINEGEIIFVLESMKMKTNISAPFTGKIKTIEVHKNDTIDAGQQLLTFE